MTENHCAIISAKRPTTSNLAEQVDSKVDFNWKIEWMSERTMK